MMPSSKKQSETGRKKTEHKLYLARESPESSFDLAQCELYEIPSGVFSLCRVLRKEALLLNSNCLRSLQQHGGGKLSDLQNIRLLDLHSNQLSDISKEIHHLKSLQVLNLEDNQITTLPSEISRLDHLQTLNLRKNKLKVLPDSICHMKSLRLLDISENSIQKLPKHLCHVKTLENLIISAEHFTYPPKSVCEQGTAAIMKYLCKECDVEYEAPSRYTLNVLGPNSPPILMSGSSSMDDVSREYKNIMDYERLKEERRQRVLAIERELDGNIRAHAEMAAKQNQSKFLLLDQMAQEEEAMMDDITKLQLHREGEHKKLVNKVYEAENDASLLVNQLLEINEKARTREEFMDRLEREREEAENWFLVRREESESLRRAEILDAMDVILNEDRNFDELIQRQFQQREEAQQKARNSITELDHTLVTALNSRYTGQIDLVQKLAMEERMQKEAFGTLQLQKDGRTQRIMQQISLIEDELCLLTQLEMERRSARRDDEARTLTERRADLVKFLGQLWSEREDRVYQLRSRMLEMEAQREKDQLDYWLIQYQRLLDRKPEALMDAEHQLEKAVIRILTDAHADDFLPQFQTHRITIETLRQITEKDLEQIGVNRLGTRRAILRAVEDFKKVEEKERRLEPVCPSAPTCYAAEVRPSPQPGQQAGASAPVVVKEVTARVEIECCICLDKKSAVLFMNCGHVCCCSDCSPTVNNCPLCREPIVQRVRLQGV